MDLFIVCLFLILLPQLCYCGRVLTASFFFFFRSRAHHETHNTMLIIRVRRGLAADDDYTREHATSS